MRFYFCLFLCCVLAHTEVRQYSFAINSQTVTNPFDPAGTIYLGPPQSSWSPIGPYTSTTYFLASSGGAPPQYPGPLIKANVGDTINITVANKIFEGPDLSLHWHGIHHKVGATNWADGTAWSSECPTKETDTTKYRFVVDRAGDYFWHGHNKDLFPNGLFGPLIVRYERPTDDPHNQLYDHDLDEHVLLISEQFNMGGVFLSLSSPVYPFINGKTEGARFTVTPGSRYRFRIINANQESARTVIQFQGHPFTVISVQNTYIVPIVVRSYELESGGRISVVITADQNVDNYVISTHSQDVLLGPAQRDPSGNPIPGARAWLHYDGAPEVPPSFDDPFPDLDLAANFNDAVPFWFQQLVPLTNLYPPAPVRVSQTFISPLTFNLFSSAHGNLPDFSAHESKTPYKPPFVPTLESRGRCGSHPNTHIWRAEKDQWIDIFVVNLAPIAHPMHLHGYNFFVLGKGDFTLLLPTLMSGIAPNPNDPDGDVCAQNGLGSLYAPFYGIPGLDQLWACNIEPSMVDPSQINTANPMYVDTVGVPPSTWTWLRVRTDNAGSWPFHCHIHGHAGLGMRVDLLVGSNNNRDWPQVPEGLSKCQKYSIGCRGRDMDDASKIHYAWAAVALVGVVGLGLFARRRLFWAVSVSPAAAVEEQDEEARQQVPILEPALE